MRHSILAGALLLSGCGIPTNPEKGPVVLLCEGEEVIHSANGEIERNKRREFYRIDGVAHEIATWNDDSENFGIGLPGLVVTATQARYMRNNPVVANITGTTMITFDRVSGTVTDANVMSNGSNLTFRAPCRPVKDPTSEKKF